MASILRVKLNWTGFPGAPGLTVFHFRDFDGGGDFSTQAQAATSRVELFAGAIKDLLPSTASLRCASDVEEIEETTGELVNIHPVTAANGTISNASAAAVYSGPVGAVINWRTNGVRNGRRIRGRSFIVPITGDKFDASGTLATATITTLQNAANALVNPAGSPDLGVYARPTAIKDAQGNPTGEHNADGIWYVAAAANVPDLAAVMRSRRD